MVSLPKVCSCTSCPNKASTLVNGEKLLACSICRSQWYCSKECQKNAWTKEGHKYCCAKSDVPRHAVDGTTIEDIQSTIDAANPGDIIVLKEGEYSSRGDEEELTISKPIRLIGPPSGMNSVKLNCTLQIDDEISNKGSVTVLNLTIIGNIKVKTNYYESVTFCSVKSQQDDPEEDGVMVHIMKGGKCLFFQCELVGGDEALYIDGIDDLSNSRENNANKVHIKRCIIRNGSKRGICADDKFILENSVIRDNGWYGIRSNLGWTDKGNNDWQRNPMKPNAGPNGGGGMFDGPAIPLNGAGGLFSGDTAFPGFGQHAQRRR